MAHPSAVLKTIEAAETPRRLGATGGVKRPPAGRAAGARRASDPNGIEPRAALRQALGVLVAQALLVASITEAEVRKPATGAGKGAGARPAAQPSWEIISDANEVRGLAFHGDRLYAATGGGTVVWDLRTGKLLRKWTTLDGLLGTRGYAITVCPLPDPKVVIGTQAGLSLYDIAKQKWESVTPYSSGLTAGNVTALASDPRRQVLYIGHGYAGLDIFDAKRNAWRHLATVNGLPSNRVEAVALAKGGDQVWVVCRTGAALLEGQDIRVWKMSDIGLASELTSAVTADAAGTAWLIASNGSLLRFARGKWKVYGAGQLGGVSLRPEAGIATSPEGALWFVTSRGELCHFDPTTEKCARRGSIAGGTGLFLGPGGSLLVASNTGARMLPAGSGATWRSFVVAGDVLSSNQIVALAEDRAGTIWIATGAGVYTLGGSGAQRRIAPIENPTEKIGRGRVVTLYADPRGGMWFGTTAGAAFFDGSSWRRVGRGDGLVGDTVQAIVRDGRGQTWLGTSRGIGIWDGRETRSITARDGLRSEDVHSLFSRGDVVWAGTREFMFRFDRGKLEFLDDEVMGVEFETMRVIAGYKSDSLILGTTNGLAYIDGRTGRDDTEIYGDPVSDLVVANGGDLWVGTDMRGLFHRVGAEWVNLTTNHGLPSNLISALLLDRQGVLWIGTADAGLARHVP